MDRNNTSVRLMARAYLLSLVFWLSLALLAGGQSYLQGVESHLPVKFSNELMVYGARYLTVALLTPPIFYWVNRWPVSGAQRRRIAVYALAYVPFSCAFALIRWLILPPWLEETLAWGPRSLLTLFELTYSTFADVFVLFLGVLIAAHAYTYFVRVQRQEIERLRLRQSLAQSELQALRAQLHPHFLFNTLQGVSTLIDSDPATAQKMLFTLATLLRVVLKHGSVDLISLAEELRFLRAYLDLEHMRLGSRLNVRWDIEPNAEEALLPQLVLQPLVENAIIHGIANAREGGWVEISGKIRHSRLEVEVRNSFAGPSVAGSGLGLTNVNARVQHLYADDEQASFDFRIDGARAVARLVVPAFAPLSAASSRELETV